MILDLHPDIRIQKLTIGLEKAPLVVIDNFIADADKLVRRASWRQFTVHSQFFPGIRIEAPSAYRKLFVHELQKLLLDYFQFEAKAFNFTMCHYSLVTTPPEELAAIQRIPHIDSLATTGLASIHYLFKRNLGGTAFYRHRKTGFEFVDESRKDAYFSALAAESEGPNAPRAEYINGDTELFEQILKQDGVFNRILIYRRNSLHSGSIGKDFIPDPNPLTGRLSINSFIDLVP